MTTIKLKRVYDNYDEKDGFRVFIDKLWPRGMKKESLKMDMWNKDIAPSAELRKWFHQDSENRWDEFSNYYMRELNNSEAAKDFANRIK